MIISKDYAFERHSTTKKVTTLSKLIDIGIKDQYAAQKVFEAFLQEVGTQKEWVYFCLICGSTAHGGLENSTVAAYYLPRSFVQDPRSSRRRRAQRLLHKHQLQRH
ncbi:hypothetical protein BC936DRAFT_148421 [Jimgerdemannia flammicorona]|nr:hypothetical protein BC936DRAFT_148421 [Jimgerdemannia flammicorona]